MTEEAREADPSKRAEQAFLDDATLVEPSPLDTGEVPVLAPPTAPPPRWARTWALGSGAVVLAGFLAVTGLLLMLHYRPLVHEAHTGLVDLVEASPWSYLRALHLWGSHLLLIVTLLHLLRVVVTRSYRPPRRANYHVGLALLVFVIAMALTGYLLPWNESSRWLLHRLIGEAPGNGFLTSVYALHCAFLPVAAVLLLAYHVYRARLDDRANAPGA